MCLVILVVSFMLSYNLLQVFFGKRGCFVHGHVVFYALIQSSSSFWERRDAFYMGMLSLSEKFVLTGVPCTCWILCTCRQSECLVWRWLRQSCIAQQNQAQKEMRTKQIVFFFLLVKYSWRLFFLSPQSYVGHLIPFTWILSSYSFILISVFLLLFLLFAAFPFFFFCTSGAISNCWRFFFLRNNF